MEIETKYFGKITINKEDIVKFESGIPGFLAEKQFVLVPMADTPFWIMQSVMTKDIAFVMTNPFSHFPTYEFKLSEEVQETLEIKEEADVAVFTILTVADPFTNTTANLKAPIIINNRTKLGKQIILNDENFETKHLLVSKSPQQIRGTHNASIN